MKINLNKKLFSDLNVAHCATINKNELNRVNEDIHHFANSYLKYRFLIGEEVVALDADWSYLYASDVICGRFELAEKIISGDAGDAYYYALHIIQGRWPAGEEAISKHAGYAYEYALHIIQGPWPMGEKAIAESDDHKKAYEELFCIKLQEGKSRQNP